MENTEESKMSAVVLAQKCDSVFEVILSYVDAEGGTRTVKTGAGFLIGNSEEAAYVITGSAVLCADEELCTQLRQEYSLTEETELQFATCLVVKSDVAINAEVLVSSEEMGFAVLKLEQPIYGREALCLSANPQDVQAMDTVYSVWGQDNMAEGQVFKWLDEGEASTLWHNAVLIGQGIGNPLLDECGNVIGVNTELMENGYVEAVNIQEVIAVLDVFGVPYSIAELAETEPYTEQTVMTPADTVQIIETEPLTPLFWMGIAIVVLLLAGIVLLVCRIVAGDRKKEKQTVKEEKRPNFVPERETPSTFNVSKTPITFTDETTVLGAGFGPDMDATTVLGSGLKQEENKGFLTREKTGERICLDKSLFVLGTDGLRVDYCIKDNKSVSRVHAQIRRVNGEMTLENLRATNGTYLNGVRLQDNECKILHSNDNIRLANENFLFTM